MVSFCSPGSFYHDLFISKGIARTRRRAEVYQTRFTRPFKTRQNTVSHGCGWFRFVSRVCFIRICSFRRASVKPNDECKESHIDFRVDSKRAQPRSPRLKFISFWFRSSCCQTAQKTQPRRPAASPSRLSSSSHRSKTEFAFASLIDQNRGAGT